LNGLKRLQAGEEISSSRSDQLIGSRAGDPADLRICTNPSYIGLAPGLSIYSWDLRERAVPSPPRIQNGPFTELRLAPSPAAAVFGLMLRRRSGSLQSIWQVLRDAQRSAIYRVEAPGVRIKDCRSDSRLAGGLLELRKEGELARKGLDLAADGRERTAMGAAAGVEGNYEERTRSEEWTTLDGYFDGAVAAIELPDDSKLRLVRADWALVGSSPRLEALVADGSLSLIYVGKSQVRLRDLLRMRDVSGRRAGGRVAYFLARETASDLFSFRRRSGFKDWLKLATALVGALSGLGSLSWLLSQLI